jgi:hypothetical protein
MDDHVGGSVPARGTSMTPVDAPPSLASRLAWSFLVGALAMLTFHQAGVGLFHAAGLFPMAPFELRPAARAGRRQRRLLVRPVGILFLLVVLPRMRRVMPGWAAGLLFGFVVPVAVLFLVVAPLKGQPIALGQPLGSMVRIALVHAFWGLGMVIIWQGLRELVGARAG